MKKRVITGIVVSVIGILIVCFSHIDWLFRCIVALLTLLCVNEAVPLRWIDYKIVPICIVLGVAVFSAIEIPNYDDWVAPVYIVASVVFILLIVMNEAGLKPENNYGWLQILVAVISVMFLHSAIYLRQDYHGLYYILVALLSAILTDTFALAFGRAFGKHKLVPKTSPKKTIEGSIGGLISSVLVIVIMATLLQHFTDVSVNGTNLILCSLLSSVMAQVGDLSMSVVKRSMGIKDFGNLLPGHGGVLDRLDSILFTLPLYYILVSCGVVIFR